MDRSRLPEGARPGSVLRVALSEVSGRPDWGSAELAEDEAESLLEEARETLEELKKRDPGGGCVALTLPARGRHSPPWAVPAVTAASTMPRSCSAVKGLAR